MAAKPGAERTKNGKTYIFTGQAWVPVPRINAARDALKRKIAEWDKTRRAGTATKDVRSKYYLADAEKMWRSRFASSGTVAAAGGGDKEEKPKSKTAGPATGTYTASYAKPKGKDKPKTEKEKKLASAKIAKPAGAATTSSKAAAKKPATPVSQSRTMWVKKGEMVGGKEVKKGYLAQYGKPEKRVTAPVKLVEGTRRGKVGETVDYKKGRYKKKSGK